MQGGSEIAPRSPRQLAGRIRIFLPVATAYAVICQGEFSGGVIVKLKEMGMYRVSLEPGRFDDEETKHELQVEAGSPEDAILRAKGAVAVAGGQARNYKVEEGRPVGGEPEAGSPGGGEPAPED